jgi:class 3 adenylate cyclase
VGIRRGRHARAAQRRDDLIETIAAAHAGIIHRPRGEGNCRFGVFRSAIHALAAAFDMQLALQTEAWPTSQPVRVRMAPHTGEADLRDGDYYGPAVNRCARLRAIAVGGRCWYRV